MTNSSNLEVNLQKALTLLRQGDVVAFPTETVYGLGASIDSDSGIQKIFSVKQRPFFDPLIVHVDSIAMAQTCFQSWNPLVQALAEKFWPGPITFVMTKSDRISDLITSGLAQVGVRWPKHLLAQQLIHELQIPIAAPSANRFGKTSPTQAQHVRKEFNDQVFVLDQGESEIGIESTVLLIKPTSPQNYELAILRRGALVKSVIDDFLKTKNFKYSWYEATDKKEAPGHMKHHYMPEIPLVICRNQQMKVTELVDILNQRLHELPDQVEGVQIVKPAKKIEKLEFLRLSANPEQAARELYAKLRSASERKPEALCFIQTQQHQSEMWDSILDRLYKAASLIVD